MREPMTVQVDLEIPAAYIKYADGESVQTRDILDGGTVAYDVDAQGQVVGLEILWIDDPAHVEAAETFARDHGLAFPRNLAGNLTAA